MQIVIPGYKMPGLEKFSVKQLFADFFLLQWVVEPQVCSCNRD